MIEYILLDLDDTILDFRWAENQAIRRTLTAYGIAPSDAVIERYRTINFAHWRMLERKEITREELQVSRFRQLQQELELEGDPVAFSELYVRCLSEGHCFLPGAEETLRRLAKRYRLFLVTNGTARVQHSRLASAGIAPLFEKLFISEEQGANKPQVEYFDRCFAQIPGFRKDRAIIVGDSLNSDIRGGINAGILTCWVNPTHRPERDGIHPDYQIENLPQLLPILETL